jgi:excisionase family DNA binding protein
MTEDVWLTADEVARELRVHIQTVRRWIKQDGLPAVLFGRRAGYRIKRSDLDAFLEEKGKAAPVAA